ncbi:uncharacterized protein BJ171DRAFT_418538 [Polychytrium aggregatum]|uniref:uncharacterized protein n=1 Tax=Polychytrium aggregatum TaxID=110093 RepID=UPI0022FEA2CD|nr:uncharacterized protein BJ171DRAFT_418538 [Polychytrium aggregatum]KAI9209472.1 hypothetical protein BJ171DRAFT_418538 [Polychytrium aggregatum]
MADGLGQGKTSLRSLARFARSGRTCPSTHLLAHIADYCFYPNRYPCVARSKPPPSRLWTDVDVQLLRLEAQDYRALYHSLHASYRKSTALRIFNSYLSAHAVLPLRWGSKWEPTFRKVLTTIKSNLDAVDITLYDELGYLTLQVLEDIYDGAFPCDDLNDQSDAPFKDAPAFERSAFYQAMCTDLCGTRHLTTAQYNRAGERIMDMPVNYFSDPEVVNRIIQMLESMEVDCHNFRNRGVHRTGSIGKQSGSKSKSPGQTSSKSTAIIEEETPPQSSYPSKTSSKRSSSLQKIMDTAHAFIQQSSHDKRFCEACFLRLSAPSEEQPQAPTMYQCQSCGIICHKTCRNKIGMPCIKKVDVEEDDANEQMHSEKVRKLTEKIQAIQKEVDIEMKIQDGLDKMNRAKTALSPSKKKSTSSSEPELTVQAENSNKKLEVLKHELQKCRLQLAALTAAVTPTSNYNKSLGSIDKLQSSDEPDTSNVKASTSTAPPLQDSINNLDEIQKGEVIKLTSVDSQSKTESTKAFFITPQMTCRDLIVSAISKFMLPGFEEEYQVFYPSEYGDVPLRGEDHPLSLGTTLTVSNFKLAKKFDSSRRMELNEQRKQMAVVMEICDTETAYFSDLSNLVEIFMKPLLKIGPNYEPDVSMIFSNIQTLLATHGDISKRLNQKRDELVGNLTMEMLGIFKDKLGEFDQYVTYCSNQHTARRHLAKMRQDVKFNSTLLMCEANPKLHKLALTDLLVKPLHRITRYPLLFKRLLSHTAKVAPEYEITNKFITDLDAKIQQVNDEIHLKEAAYRINYIDENIEFPSGIEKFKLADAERELISEKTFTLLKKNTAVSYDIIVMLFSDLVLLTKPKKGDQFVLLKPPIPFEAAVFLDKTEGSEGRSHIFQIIHLQQEVYTLEAFSAFDKNSWLGEAERLRSLFCCAHLGQERAVLQPPLEAYTQTSFADDALELLPSPLPSPRKKPSPSKLAGEMVLAFSDHDVSPNAPAAVVELAHAERISACRSFDSLSVHSQEAQEPGTKRTSSAGWGQMFKGVKSSDTSKDMARSLDSRGVIGSWSLTPTDRERKRNSSQTPSIPGAGTPPTPKKESNRSDRKGSARAANP